MILSHGVKFLVTPNQINIGSKGSRKTTKANQRWQDTLDLHVNRKAYDNPESSESFDEMLMKMQANRIHQKLNRSK